MNTTGNSFTRSKTHTKALCVLPKIMSGQVNTDYVLMPRSQQQLAATLAAAAAAAQHYILGAEHIIKYSWFI